MKTKMRTVVLFAVLLCTCTTAAAKNLSQLNFSFITSLTGDFDSSGGITAVDIALEQINSSPDILPNYTLGYTEILDSNCNPTPSLMRFFQHFKNLSQPTYISLLGCGCSSASIPVAEKSHFWNIPQIAYVASATVFDDRTRFPGFFRMLPSLFYIPAALAAFSREMGWSQVAMITQDVNIWSEIVDSAVAAFEHEGIYLDTSITLPAFQDPFPYERLFNWEQDYRIIYMNTYQEYAITIICEAYYRGLVGEEYVFMNLGAYTDGWWMLSTNSSCPPEVLGSVVVNGISFVPDGFVLKSNESDFTISGLTPTNFMEEYDKRSQLPQYQDYGTLTFVGVAYDTMWAMAVGLHNAAIRVSTANDTGCGNKPGQITPLENFDYFNEKMGCILRQAFDDIRFPGITGDIQFDVNGSRPDNVVQIRQLQENGNGQIKNVRIGNIFIEDHGTRIIYNTGGSVDSIFPYGVVYDGFSIPAINVNALPLVIIYMSLASCGLIYTVCCLVFITIFRKKSVVKLSSPNVNYLLIAGAALMYSCVFLYTFSLNDIDGALEQTILCNVREWMFSLGYTLCFGVILVKTVRIYYIFTNPTARKKALKDWMLITMVLLVVGVDLSIHIIGTAVPEARLNATLVPDELKPRGIDAEGHNIDLYIFICTNPNTIIWLAVSFAYKGLLQILAIFMAFHTRKVKIKALNDSKEIAAIIYINNLVLVTLIMSEFALISLHNIYPMLFGMALLVGATIFLSLIFVPQAVSLYRDPNGEKVLDTTPAANIGLQPQPSKYNIKSNATNIMGKGDQSPFTALQGGNAQLEAAAAAESETCEAVTPPE